MRRRYILGILAVLGVAVLTVQAEDFWVKKDWKQWSQSECAKMLQDSPWTKKWTKGEVTLSAALPGGAGTSSDGGAGENSPEMHYYVQLRSATPVREAYVRQMQIANKYDKMDDAHKKAFDAQTDAYLAKTYDDVILVHVEFGSNLQNIARDMAVYWKSIPPESIPTDTYLINQKGDHILPVKFISPPTGSYAFEMLFPRMQNNEPVVREGDKTLAVQFTHPAVGMQAQNGVGQLADTSAARFDTERVLADFKLDKMTWKGKPAF